MTGATWRAAARQPDGSIQFTDTAGGTMRASGPAAERMAGTLEGYDATAGLDPMEGPDLNEKDADVMRVQAGLGQVNPRTGAWEEVDPLYGPDLNDESASVGGTHAPVRDAPARPAGGGLYSAVDPGLARQVVADREAQMATASAKAAPKKPVSMMLDVGPAGSAPPPVSVGLGGPVWTVTPAAQPDRSVLAAAGQAAAAGGLGAAPPERVSRRGGEGTTGAAPAPREAVPAGAIPYQIADGPARVAIPTEAPAAGTPGGALVATPQQAQGGAPGAAGGPAALGSEADRLRLRGFNEAEIAAEMRKRASPGYRVAEAQQLTDRTLQIAGGPSPETVAEQEGVIRRSGQVKAGRQDLNDAEKAEQARVAGLRGNTEGIYDKRIQETLAARDKTLADLGAQREALYKDIAQTEIDPKRLWKSKSTGEQLISVLAMAFSGMGAAIQGRGAVNLAMKAFDDDVAADIEAQKGNLAKKQWQASELGRVYEQTKAATGDKVISLNETKAYALRRFDQLAAQKAAIVGTPEALQKAAEISLDVDGRIADLHAASDARVSEGQHIRVIPAHMAGGGGGPDPKKVRALLEQNVKLATDGESHGASVAKDMREGKGKPGDDPAAGFVPLGSSGVDVSHLPHDERAKVRAIASSYQQATGSVAELQKMSVTDKANPFSVKGNTYADDVAYSYALIKGQGQTNKDQMEVARGQLGTAWKVGGPEAIKRVLDGAAKATARVYGRGAQ